MPTVDIIKDFVTSNVKEGIAFNTSANRWRRQFWLTWPGKVAVALTPPQVAASGTTFHALWADARSGTFQLLGRGLVAGTPRLRIRRYTNQARGVWAPASVVESQGAVAAVAEDYSTLHGRGEIFYLRDDGVSITYDRLTANTALSTQPAVALDGADAAHVVFQDDRSGNWDICYKRQDP